MEELTGFTKGVIKQPLLMILYGVDGVGKSSLAAKFPSAVFIGPERGTANLDVSRFSVDTWMDTLSRTKDLLDKKHDFQTVVYDSLDFIESLMWKHICKTQGKESIEDCYGSYGKWVNGTVQEFSLLMDGISKLREKRNMNAICIAHSQVKTVNDPSQLVPYDRYTLKLQERSSAKWKEFVDAVLFCQFEDTVFKISVQDKKGKSTGSGDRKLFTTRQSAFDAKNRYGLPDQLDLDYDKLMDAIRFGQPDSIEQIRKDLSELSLDIKKKDPAMHDRMGAAILNAGDDLFKLLAIRKQALKIVES